MDPTQMPPEMDVHALWLGLLPMLIFSIPIAIFGYVLAQQKGRNHIAWLIWGLVPFINMFAVWYFIGATNLKLERKLDGLVSKIDVR
jgi:hypothetical protein